MATKDVLASESMIYLPACALSRFLVSREVALKTTVTIDLLLFYCKFGSRRFERWLLMAFFLPVRSSPIM
jgi:hypothetical protein